MNELIKQAITNKKLIEFLYKGHPRVIEPHVLGVNDNVTQVLGFQVGGSSSTGRIPEWRRFDVQKIAYLNVTEIRFLGRQPNPSGKHSSWDYKIETVS